MMKKQISFEHVIYLKSDPAFRSINFPDAHMSGAKIVKDQWN
jgi:hypothetical protein